MEAEEYDAEQVYEFCRDLEDVTEWFFALCGQAIVGKNKWVKLRYTKRWPEFVSPSCEAFALLALENSKETWKMMAKNEMLEEDAKAEVPRPLYTVGGMRGGKNPGWSDEGKARFKEFLKDVKRTRALDSKKGDQSMENTILEKWKEKHLKKKNSGKEKKPPECQKDSIDRSAAALW